MSAHSPLNDRHKQDPTCYSHCISTTRATAHGFMWCVLQNISDQVDDVNVFPGVVQLANAGTPLFSLREQLLVYI